MSDYPMLISNKLHSFRNFRVQKYIIFSELTQVGTYRSFHIVCDNIAKPYTFGDDEFFD